MAYQTGSATSPDNLLETLKIWLESLGWDVDLWATDTFNYATASGINGAGKRLHVHKTTAGGTLMHFNFRSAIRGFVTSDAANYQATFTNPSKYCDELTGIAMNGSTGYSTNIAKAITGISNWGGHTVYISCSNRFQNGDSVTIAGTTDYNGTYTIANCDTSGFSITIAGYWTSSQTGTATGPNRCWCEQPGAHIGANGSWAMCLSELSTTAIPAYHFFNDGDTYTVVVEYSAGKFQFLCFGCLEKQGAYTGGQFFAGSYRSWYNCYAFYRKSESYYQQFFAGPGSQNGYYHGGCYVDVDGTAAFRVADANCGLVFPGPHSEQDVNNYQVRQGLCHLLMKKSPNSYNGMAAMFPIYVMAKRSNSLYSLLGWPKSIRFIRKTYYSGGDEIMFGSETWKIFDVDKDASTGGMQNIGVAIKKVV